MHSRLFVVPEPGSRRRRRPATATRSPAGRSAARSKAAAERLKKSARRPPKTLRSPPQPAARAFLFFPLYRSSRYPLFDRPARAKTGGISTICSPFATRSTNQRLGKTNLISRRNLRRSVRYICRAAHSACAGIRETHDRTERPIPCRRRAARGSHEIYDTAAIRLPR